jgi:predicted small integral membrane protein
VLDLSWMAWTWPTAAFFVVLVLSIVTMGIWEKFSPGGNPRRGVFGIDTTRGDRLFISWLGSGFISLGWLAFYGTPLWGALLLNIGWFVFVFRKV